MGTSARLPVLARRDLRYWMKLLSVAIECGHLGRGSGAWDIHAIMKKNLR